MLIQGADEDCGQAFSVQMHAEPYFVDFLREAPEATGQIRNYNIDLMHKNNAFF